MPRATHARPAVALLLTPLLLSACSTGVPFIPPADAKDLPTVASCDVLRSRLTAARGGYGRALDDFDTMAPPMPMKSSEGLMMQERAPASTGMSRASDGAADSSTTNVQVAGVDEGDRVQTDGRSIYTLSGGTIRIVRALPADGMVVEAQLDFASQQRTPTEFYLASGHLVVLGSTVLRGSTPSTGWRRDDEVAPSVRATDRVAPSPYVPQRSGSFAAVYDLADPTSPRQERLLELEGRALTSRVIDGTLYVASVSAPWYGATDASSDDALLPLFRDSVRGSGSYAPLARCTDVKELSSDRGSLLTVLAVPVAGGAVGRQVILGGGETVYASQGSLYVAGTQEVETPLFWRAILPGSGWSSSQATRVAAFTLDGTRVQFRASGSVPGSVLNQFSMDESDAHLRIATTENSSANHVFVLDEQLRVTGTLRDLAPGERIYSARFMGERAYLVTFKQVDPLFVLDLSDPTDPRVLGALKIPGYSDYLHPYDATHLIGLGKDTVDNGSGGAIPTGLKLALFDVSDVTNPRQVAATTIGTRGSDSPALHDHHAFRFDRARNLLVLPVTVAEALTNPCDLTPCPVPMMESMPGSVMRPIPVPPPVPQYGSTAFQGAYVYNLTLKGGFDLKGKIAHGDDPASAPQIARSLTIGDVLYTVSDARVMAHGFLDGMEELGRVSLTGSAPDAVDDGGWMRE